MQKITPFLWFDKNCEEAINYYVGVFNGAPGSDKQSLPDKSGKSSKINFIQRYEKGIEAPGAEEMEGKIITAEFELAGQKFQALDGGSIFKFNEAISLMIDCRDQEEVDYFWEKLSANPENEQCGWCKDKFGLSWQIIPQRLNELAGDPNREKAHKVVNAMLEMKKIDIAKLEEAYNS